MIKIRVRRMVERGGKFYYQASPAMRAVGIFSEALGADMGAAVARAEELNAAWDAVRRGEEKTPPRAAVGSTTWLMDRFQKDQVFYLSKNSRTRDEIGYAFRVIEPVFGDVLVKHIERRHCRAFYNRLREQGSAHKAQKLLKWFRRLMAFAVEEGLIAANPAAGMRIQGTPGRSQRWAPEEVAAVLQTCIAAGRPSLALATQLAYDTTQRQQDILGLMRSQFDGEGLTVKQRKTGREVWVPLSPESIAMIQAAPKNSIYLIVSEETGRPYTDRNVFSRIFRRFKLRAGVTRDLTFHDLRRTGITELGNAGATEAEIVATSGHAPGSPVLRVYLKPGREAAIRGAAKRQKVNRSLKTERGEER